MGNCQAVDTATLAIQHPSGKVDQLYWPVAASEIMKMNPGHYVALLISTTLCPSNKNDEGKNKKENNSNQVRLTRIKLLRPTDTLVLGQVYRLISTQEVTKGLKAKKHANIKKYQLETADKSDRKQGKPETFARKSETDANQVTKTERHRQRTTGSTNSATARSRNWQPSLQSISEAGS